LFQLFLKVLIIINDNYIILQKQDFFVKAFFPKCMIINIFIAQFTLYLSYVRVVQVDTHRSAAQRPCRTGRHGGATRHLRGVVSTGTAHHGYGHSNRPEHARPRAVFPPG